jgi:hypothetical protein
MEQLGETALDKYIVLRNEDYTFTAFNKVKPNPSDSKHIVYGEYMPLTFDIDNDDLDFTDITKENLDGFINKIYEILPQATEHTLIDRCRKNKQSYHLRFNVYTKREQILTFVNKLQKIKGIDNDICVSIDTKIYRLKGSL